MRCLPPAAHPIKSARGRWLIGKDLHEAIEVLRKEAKPALADIGDLEILAERLFPFTPSQPISMP
jgi:hypothetical protein